MKWVASISALLVLSACASPPPPVAEVAPARKSVVEVPPEHIGGQLTYELSSGDYHCEFGQKLDVQRDVKLKHRINIGWNGGRYDLERDPSFSGLPRYEDRTNGLVWIELPWKGVLLDGKTQKPLANECRNA